MPLYKTLPLHRPTPHSHQISRLLRRCSRNVKGWQLARIALIIQSLFLYSSSIVKNYHNLHRNGTRNELQEHHPQRCTQGFRDRLPGARRDHAMPQPDGMSPRTLIVRSPRTVSPHRSLHPWTGWEPACINALNRSFRACHHRRPAFICDAPNDGALLPRGVPDRATPSSHPAGPGSVCSTRRGYRHRFPSGSRYATARSSG